jgi:hypothetical protein
MGTHAAIAKKLEDATYKWIYVHYDGGLDHVGKLLHNFYNSPELVDALLELGDLSYLGDKRENTFSYYYDRGEKEKSVLAKRCFHVFPELTRFSYQYIFDNGKWFYASYRRDPIELSEVIVSKSE